MKFKNESNWLKWKEANTDPYGKAAVDYAEAWADLMEVRMSGGEELADIAKQASYDANTDDITGFMYGCAVSVLADVWMYGEELRQWHNLDTQIGVEGEKANKTGGTLNPALINTVGKEVAHEKENQSRGG